MAAEFEQMCFTGDLNDTDRRILKFIFSNPDSSHEEIATAIGYSRSGISRRMSRIPFIKARMLFEGTVTDKMQAAMFKLARNVNRIMDNYEADENPIELFKKAAEVSGDVVFATKVVNAAMAKSDPKVMLEAGKIAMSFVAKQAELDILAQKQNAKPEQLPTLEEARRILSEDPAMSDAIDVEVEDL